MTPRVERPARISASEVREVEPGAPIPMNRRGTELYGQAQTIDMHREILELLTEHIDTTDIVVVVKGTKITLTGWVQQPLDRQIAEDLVWSVPKVRLCDNRLEPV